MYTDFILPCASRDVVFDRPSAQHNHNIKEMNKGPIMAIDKYDVPINNTDFNRSKDRLHHHNWFCPSKNIFLTKLVEREREREGKKSGIKYGEANH